MWKFKQSVNINMDKYKGKNFEEIFLSGIITITDCRHIYGGLHQSEVYNCPDKQS
jgi:hypothetical protein